MTEDEIKWVRYSQRIEDPFPEHTLFERIKPSLGLFDRIFGWTPEPPERVSIHEAYKKGYDKAYAEMLSACSHQDSHGKQG